MNTLKTRFALALAALALTACQALAPPREAAATRQMRVNGTSLTYVEEGRGVPIVLVHGGIGDHRVWAPQREALGQTHRVIAIDQRYFGTAPWSDNGERFGLATQVDDLAAFIRGLNAGPVYLVGWSMSGPSTLSVAMRHPELVRGVLVYEPSIGLPQSDPALTKTMNDDRAAMFAEVRVMLKAGDAAAAAKALIDQVEDQPDTFATMPAWRQQIALDNARTLTPMFGNPPLPPPSCEQLGRIERPVTIMLGELSRPYFRLAAEAASRCIRGARLLIAPGQRHLSPARDPDRFTAALREFVAANR
jgi:pimeloyl-ACP methyl ester carboxylesterase